MSARYRQASPPRGSLGTMVGIVWRTHRRGILVWVIALAACMIGTAAAVADLYGTPAKVHAYAEAVTSGSALAAINGHVEGIDSLGGVIQDEFGFLASFLLPLLGIALIAGSTRREEESGRLETILAGRIARRQPALAALTVAAAAVLVTSVLFATGLALSGAPVSGSILYSAALGALAFVFAGFAALLAQLVRHARGVYAWSLVLLAGAYVLRGIGDTATSWLTWLSPLGWAEKTAPFGNQRWWMLAVPVVAGLASGGAAVRLAARRDPALPCRHRRRVRHPGNRHPPRRGGRRPPGGPTRRHAVPGPLAGSPEQRRRGRASSCRRRLVVGARAVDRVVGREHRRDRRCHDGRSGLPAGGTGARRSRPGTVRPVAARLRVHMGRVRRDDLHRRPRPRPKARTMGARPCSHNACREPTAGSGRCRQLGTLAIVAIALVLIGFLAFHRRDVPRA